jgi:hypothetical protein
MARYDKAIADDSASLEVNPKWASALYVRGVAKRRIGEVKSGDADIAAAKAIDSSIDKTYADYGVRP